MPKTTTAIKGVSILTQTAEPFADHIDQITINPIAVQTRKGILLGDLSYPGELDQLSTRLEEAGHGLDEVTGVMLTHHDIDHAGATAEVVEATGATVFAHEKCAPYVDGRTQSMKPANKEADGGGYPSEPVDVELVHGVSFDTVAGPMRVVYTPGHAPGHISLYFPKFELLIAGDLLGFRDGEFAGPHDEYSPDMDQAWASVRKLAELDISVVLCHHGGLIATDSNEIRALAERSNMTTG